MQYNQNNDKKDDKKVGETHPMQNKPTNAPASHGSEHESKGESDKAMMDKKADVPEKK